MDYKNDNVWLMQGDCLNAWLMQGDCLERMKELDDNSVDSIVTDPPYGLSFMGKKWDYDVPSVEIWTEALRVLKPGGHLLAFAGTRTQHRMAVNIEDAGFEIRDMIAWIYGSGFPKSHDVSKAIDKAAGAERERIAGPKSGGMASFNKSNEAHGYRESSYYEKGNFIQSNEPATEAAKQWQGWGTALKPALEPITVARKPFKGTVAANVQEHGTGAINIDGCRVGDEVRFNAPAGNKAGGNSLNMSAVGMPEDAEGRTVEGRWPANLIHDGSDEVVELFPVSKGNASPRTNSGKGNNCYGDYQTVTTQNPAWGDQGSAARFFYCAKASKKDRGADNNHPTVKPTDLMRYLCRLVTPPNGIVLDPFMGSGSTGKAAMLEGFRFVGIELDQGYFDIACKRIEDAQRQVRGDSYRKE